MSAVSLQFLKIILDFKMRSPKDRIGNFFLKCMYGDRENARAILTRNEMLVTAFREIAIGSVFLSHGNCLLSYLEISVLSDPGHLA